jgi:hypothetical protein
LLRDKNGDRNVLLLFRNFTLGNLHTLQNSLRVIVDTLTYGLCNGVSLLAAFFRSLAIAGSIFFITGRIRLIATIYLSNVLQEMV